MIVNKNIHKWATAALLTYMLCLIWIITFKCNMVQVVAESRYFAEKLSLTERILRFASEFHGTTNSEFIVNILIFIPLGLSTPFLFEKRPFLSAILCGFTVSLALEISQLLIAIGAFAYMDIFTNTLGAILGAIMYLYFRERVTEKQVEVALKAFALIAVAVSVFGAFNTAKCFDIYITDNPSKYL